MEKDAKIHVAGHNGLSGSAILRKLKSSGYTNIIVRSSSELDLTDHKAVLHFFNDQNPAYVFFVAGKVGVILANKTYPADFIQKNVNMIFNKVDAAHRNNEGEIKFDASKPDGTVKKQVDVSKATCLGWTAENKTFEHLTSTYQDFASNYLTYIAK